MGRHKARSRSGLDFETMHWTFKQHHTAEVLTSFVPMIALCDGCHPPPVAGRCTASQAWQ